MTENFFKKLIKNQVGEVRMKGNSFYYYCYFFFNIREETSWKSEDEEDSAVKK